MKKHVFFRIHLFQKEAAEQYFQAMSKKGWMLSDMNYYMVSFTKCSPRTHYFYVGIEDHHGISHTYFVDEETKDYRSFMEEFGYRFVCGYDKIQVFESKEEKEIYSDEALDEKMLTRAVWNDEWGKSFSFLFMMLFYMAMYKPRHGYELASNLSLAAYGVIASVFAASLLGCIPVVWYLISRKQMKSPKMILWQGRAFLFLSILCMALILGAGILTDPGILWMLLLIPAILAVYEIFRKKNVRPGTANTVVIVVMLAALLVLEGYSAGKGAGQTSPVTESVLVKKENLDTRELDCLFLEVLTFKHLKDYCKDIVIKTGKMKQTDMIDGAVFYKGNEDMMDLDVVLRGDKMVIAYGGIQDVKTLLKYV